MEIIDCLYVVHRPVDVFGDILFGVGYACQVVGDERFYSVSAGLVNASTGAGGGRRTIVFSAFPLLTGIKVVYVHHNQARRSGQAVAFAVGKRTPQGVTVGQCLLLEHTIDFSSPFSAARRTVSVSVFRRSLDVISLYTSCKVISL